MILYLSIIGVCWLIISGIVTLIFWQPVWQVVLWTLLAVVLVMVLDALTATVARLLPPPKDSKFFEVSQKEKNRYEKWNIRAWKDLVPEIGHFTGFRKNKIADPKSAAYVERFLMESRYGEVGHLLSCPTGALIFLLGIIPVFPAFLWMSCLGVFAVNFVLNLPPVFILRYNYYKLSILHKSLLKKEKAQEIAA